MKTASLSNTQVEESIKNMINKYGELANNYFVELIPSYEKMKKLNLKEVSKESKYVVTEPVKISEESGKIMIGEIKEIDYHFEIMKQIVLNSFSNKSTLSKGAAHSMTVLVASGNSTNNEYDEQCQNQFNMVSHLVGLSAVLDYCANNNKAIYQIFKNMGIDEKTTTNILDFRENHKGTGQAEFEQNIKLAATSAELNSDALEFLGISNQLDNSRKMA